MTTVEVDINVDKLGAAALLEIFCITVVDEEALGAVTLLLILGVGMDVLAATVDVATMVLVVPVCVVATTELDSLVATLVAATLPVLLRVDTGTEVD